MGKEINLNRLESIVLSLYELGDKSSKNIAFEDLVVYVFKKFPSKFHLKGYPEYPDSEGVNNALYHSLKEKGFILYGNKMFSLTERGIIFGEKLDALTKGKQFKESFRLSSHISKEIKRIKELDGFNYFFNNERDKILDMDFYSYLGASARSNRRDFLGKVENMDKLVEESKLADNADIFLKKIIEYHEFLKKKFHSIVDYQKNNI
ncbi:MAG: hypothetical protein PHT24_06335 [Endomicrobiaceae bacterium]|jgi:hypothetical protein|nr:hypothetical protein [Endomicrobiaceae bacterium]